MIRIVREVEIRRDSSHIVINPNKCVYLLVPSAVVKELLEKHEINLKEKDKSFKVASSCTLVCESDKPKLIYSFRKPEIEAKSVVEFRTV